MADYNLAAQYDFNFGQLLPAALEAVNIVDLVRFLENTAGRRTYA